MNKLDQVLQRSKKLLNIYFTAGFPQPDSMLPILEALEKNKVDIIEIGMPYSDPLADGQMIQYTSGVALQQGMTLDVLFDKVQQLPHDFGAALLVMGYYNQMLQYGVERFCKACKKAGIDGVIFPDLPPEIYAQQYASLFKHYDLRIVFLITPQTSTERIQLIDELTTGFIYAVADAATTGQKTALSEQQLDYFKRLKTIKTQHSKLIGFGIRDRSSYETACQYTAGAIIGSAFLEALTDDATIEQNVQTFIQTIRP